MDDTELDSRLTKHLGPKLHGIVLQKPHQTVFDFKNELRRPESAKANQMRHSLLAFKKLTQARMLEEEQERLMQKKKEAQIKELYLDQHSWDMPFTLDTIGIFPPKKKELQADPDADPKKSKAKGKGKKGSKAKDKKEKKEVELTEEEKRWAQIEEV